MVLQCELAIKRGIGLAHCLTSPAYGRRALVGPWRDSLVELAPPDAIVMKSLESLSSPLGLVRRYIEPKH
jgi:hypothetical protein